MSLMIECPYCNLQLPVPVDNPSERIICGGCWGVFDASTFEKPTHAMRAKPVSIRPNRYDDDDGEDWEDDHPRRRRANRYRDDEDDDWDYRQRRHAPAPGESAAIASLVLGIISTLIFCLWPVGGITSIAGFVFAFYGLRTPSHKMAIWGLVLSFVGIVFAAGFAVLTIAGISLFDGTQRITPKPTPWTAPPFFPKS